MLIATLVFAVALAGAPGTTEYVPAADEAFTSDLVIDGYKNGFMPADRMMTYEGCTLERDAAYTYALMMEAAGRDGVRLEPIDCYRSYHHQKSAYNRRCPHTDVPVYDTDPITGEKFQVGWDNYRICTGPRTAQAGYSNHGWGRAVDFSNGGGTLTCRDREFRWLQANALLFGWVLPPWAQCGMHYEEPWHWEYAGLIDVDLLPILGVDQEFLRYIE